jgi:hypothetical protein
LRLPEVRRKAEAPNGKTVSGSGMPEMRVPYGSRIECAAPKVSADDSKIDPIFFIVIISVLGSHIGSAEGVLKHFSLLFTLNGFN